MRIGQGNVRRWRQRQRRDGRGGAGSKRAFVSYDMLQGNMGVEGADGACQKDADVWFQGRTFRAWISTSTESALARVGQGPWFVGSERLGTAARFRGQPARYAVQSFGDRLGVRDGGIRLDRHRQRRHRRVYHVRRLDQQGLGLTGLVGQINYAGEKWTSATTPTCDHDGHLYCLER